MQVLVGDTSVQRRLLDWGFHAWLFYYMLVVSSDSELELAVADSLRMLEGFTETMRQ